MSKTKTEIIDTHVTMRSNDLIDSLNENLDLIEKYPFLTSKLPPIIIWGSPGCGKSSIVRSVCEQRGIDFIDVRLSTMEPCDIRGLPVPNKEEKVMDWFVNGMWPRDPNGKGIIFLDEITSTDRSIQVAAYELVLDRRLGKLYTVPPGYMIIAAGNKTDDKAVAYTMSSALANRFLHIELTEDAETWCNWARNTNIHPSVVGFITYRPETLFKMENENLERGWPSPRSWERVSYICHYFKNTNETVFRKLIYGLIGTGVGAEFMNFYKINESFNNILDVMIDPNSKIEIPKEADRKYALCSAIVYLVWRGDNDADEAARINGFYRICCELTSDFASMALIAALQGKDKDETKYRCNKLMMHPMFKKWREKHGSALNKRFDISTIFK